MERGPQARKPDLSSVTLVAVTSISLAATVRALERSMAQADFGAILLLSDREPDAARPGIEWRRIRRIASREQYSWFMLRELAALYPAFCAGRPSPLPEPSIQYSDFAVWQRKWLQEERLESHLSYWRRQLDTLPVLALPTDHPRPAVQTVKGAQLFFELPLALSKEIEALSKQEGVTLFMGLLAAFKTLLYHYTDQEDIVKKTRPQKSL